MHVYIWIKLRNEERSLLCIVALRIQKQISKGLFNSFMIYGVYHIETSPLIWRVKIYDEPFCENSFFSKCLIGTWPFKCHLHKMVKHTQIV